MLFFAVFPNLKEGLMLVLVFISTSSAKYYQLNFTACSNANYLHLTEVDVVEHAQMNYIQMQALLRSDDSWFSYRFARPYNKMPHLVSFSYLGVVQIINQTVGPNNQFP